MEECGCRVVIPANQPWKREKPKMKTLRLWSVTGSGPIQPKLPNSWVLEEREGFVPVSWSWSCAEASFSLSVVRKVAQSGAHQKPPEYSALRAWR